MSSPTNNLHNLLSSVALNIRQSLQLEQILHTTAQETRRLLKTDRVIFYRFNADWGGMVVVESVSDRQWSIIGNQITDPCFKKSWLRLYQDGQVKAIEDICTADIEPCHREFLEQYQVRANLVAPILISPVGIGKGEDEEETNNLWGLLIAHHCSQPRQWQSIEEDFLGQLATQVGIAIQQSELLKQTRNQLQEWQKVEISLLESEARFRRLADNAKDVIYRYRLFPSAEIEYINPAIVDLTGYDSDRFYTDPSLLLETIHPEDRLKFSQQLQNPQADSSLLLLRFLHRDGRIIWAEQRCHHFHDNKHKLTVTEGAIREISNRLTNLDNQSMQVAQVTEDDSGEQKLNPWNLSGISTPILRKVRLWQGHVLTKQFPIWTGGLITTGLVILTEALRHWKIEPPLPFLFLMGTMVLSANFGGLTSGLVSATVVSAYIIYITILGLSAITLIPGIPQATLAIVIMFAMAVVIGRTKEHNQLLTQALHETSNTLEQRVTERTQALSKTNTRLQQEIQERQQVEDALRQSEERYTLAVRGSQAGLWDWDVMTNEIYYSPRFKGILGYGEEEIPNELNFFESCLHPQDYEPVMAAVRNHLENHMPYDVECRLCTKSGEYCWVHARGQAIWNENGQATRMAGSISDISGKKQAEEDLTQAKVELELRVAEQTTELTLANEKLQKELEERQHTEVALRESEQRFLMMANNVPMLIWASATDGLFTFFNQSWFAFTGRTRSQEMGNGWFEGVHPQDLERCLNIYQSAFANRQDFQLEYRLRRWDGEYRWVFNHGIPRFSPDEKSFLGFIGACIDISDRKQAEANLRESERRWRSLLENVRLLVVGLDLDGEIDYVNPYFLELVGYDREEVMGENWFDNLIPTYEQGKVQSYFTSMIKQQCHPYNQNSIRTKSGEERIIAWNHTLMRDLQGNAMGTLSIGEDITERYAIQRMKDEFVSVVSHELRTPLTAIHGGLDLLTTGLVSPESPQGQRILQIADESTARLVRLVNDILELERLESGKINLVMALVDAVDLMLRAVDQVQIMANRAGISIEVEQQDLEFIADGDRLIQVLTNLLSNAIKFSSRGSTVWLKVESNLVAQEAIVFTVKDQGRGIPEDKLDTVFERFHQIDASDSRREGGTGLGLAICHNIVEQHGGKIWVKSTLGKGSSFFFSIPKNISDDGNNDT